MDSKILHRISYGLFIVGSNIGDKLNGQIANSLFQVTSKPPQVAVGINKQNLTHEFLSQSKHFCASVLAKQTPLSLIGDFGFKSGRDVDKFKDISYKISEAGAPIVLDHTLGYLGGPIVSSLDVGTHTIFVAEVVDTEVFDGGEPMTYAYYHQLKTGRVAPPRQETEAPPEAPPSREGLEKYECKICGYVYDPMIGDPDSGVQPITPFKDLAPDWVCPICGAGKEDFQLKEN